MIYAEPRHVTDPSSCYFYHTLDLPGGTVPGTWDLRAGLDAYLGQVDVTGRRVLDVGAASGGLTFALEARGAEVISYDLADDGEWDLVPFAAGPQPHEYRADHQQMLARLHRSFWYAHRALASSARVVYGSVYAIPEAIGPVDVAVYGSILLHLRDPFLALQQGARLAREAVVVTEVLRCQPVATTEPYLGFLPDPATLEPRDTWWDLRPELVTRMLAVLGFPAATVTYHAQPYEGRPIELFTVVARRAGG